jgi:hypothetical protein
VPVGSSERLMQRRKTASLGWAAHLRATGGYAVGLRGMGVVEAPGGKKRSVRETGKGGLDQDVVVRKVGDGGFDQDGVGSAGGKKRRVWETGEGGRDPEVVAQGKRKVGDGGVDPGVVAQLGGVVLQALGEGLMQAGVRLLAEGGGARFAPRAAGRGTFLTGRQHVQAAQDAYQALHGGSDAPIIIDDDPVGVMVDAPVGPGGGVGVAGSTAEEPILIDDS